MITINVIMAISLMGNLILGVVVGSIGAYAMVRAWTR